MTTFDPREPTAGVSDLIPSQARYPMQWAIADVEMLNRWRAHRTGLAPYYPLLYSLVIGMGAQRVFEFGTGESSAVLLSALAQTGGRLITCSPDAPVIPMDGKVHPPHPGHWTTWPMLSSELWRRTGHDAIFGPFDIFDLVLHDGSHSAEVVAADLEGILPRVKHGGLILIHDVLHSYVGEAMRRGVGEAIGDSMRPGGVNFTGHIVTAITLPFAFGLAMVQVERDPDLHPEIGPEVSIGPDKPTSPHRTLRMTEIP